MATSFQGTINRMATCSPVTSVGTVQYDEIYQDHCHRIYSLAFWMTGNELTAEQLSTNTFLRAFVSLAYPTTDQIDRAFLTEVREFIAVGTLTLSCVAAPGTSVYGNVKRIHLEQAVLALPATERMIFLFHDVEGYEHSRIARLLGISEKESRHGLHQARLQVRSLIARMV
jgi:RNA polymerase sigma-70 factor (ECF subfamily)